MLLTTDHRSLITVFFALLFISRSLMSAASRPADADMWLLQARYYYLERFDYEKAGYCLKTALTLDPQNPKALALQEEMREIIDFLETIASPAPQIAAETVEVAESLVTVEAEIIVSAPEPPQDDFRLHLALRQIEELKFNDAVNSLEQCVTEQPENIKAFFYLMLIGEKLGRESLIQSVFDRTVKILPRLLDKTDSRDLINLVRCRMNRLIISKAVMEYNRDITLQSEAAAAFRYGFLDFDRERASYRLMTALDMELLRSGGYLASAPSCPQQGAYSLGINGVECSFHGSLLKAPYRETVVAGLSKGREPVTLAAKHKALLHIDRARKYLTEKRLYRALAEAEQVVAYDPDDFRGHDLLAQVYLGMQKPDQAVVSAEEARRLAVDEPLVYNNLGLIYMSLNRVDDAVKMFRLGLAVRKSDFDLNYNLGVAHMKKNEPALAIRHFEISVTVRPDSAGVYYNMGKIHKSLGNIDKAQECFRKMLNLVPQGGKVYNMVINILGGM
ncbi:MAG: tetratricopeptide repeat protein [Candidatus Wallbacteria bacterium]|nr:tetratricopeptide repeat protein [Candidatus Wallbacteria bacterium]